MTKLDIERLAREAGFKIETGGFDGFCAYAAEAGPGDSSCDAELLRFANAVLEEAAKVCDECPRYNGDESERAAYNFGAQDSADRIRAMRAGFVQDV